MSKYGQTVEEYRKSIEYEYKYGARSIITRVNGEFNIWLKLPIDTFDWDHTHYSTKTSFFPKVYRLTDIPGNTAHGALVNFNSEFEGTVISNKYGKDYVIKDYGNDFISCFDSKVWEAVDDLEVLEELEKEGILILTYNNKQKPDKGFLMDLILNKG